MRSDKKDFHKGFRHAALGGVLALACLLAAGCNSGAGDEATGYDAVNKADCLPAISLVDQHNHPVVLSSLKGKPVLVNFIYTSCPGPCLAETLKMARVADQLGKELGTKVTLLSFTVDPEHDGPTQLLEYTKKQGVERSGWYFVTGKPEAIDAALKNFKLVREREDDGSVDHVVGVFLLGPNGKELREYNGEILKSGAVVADINKALSKG